ncbi:hypothetical protein ASE75_14795 [Sphingomonas sp. Leaf17]|nr:hypothetical protein ASE75_14795 [Sphingomonas sp. Leaf17]
MSDAAPDGASNGRLWFLGSLPPPLNGQSNYNIAMLAYLSRIATTAVLPLGTTFAGKLWRSIANAATLLLRARAGDTVYVSVPGQSGTWLLLPAIGALRLRGLAPWLHHHSYRSINLWPQQGIRMLVAVAGRNQRHVLLSPGMRDRFAALYLQRARRQPRGQAIALSNAFLFGLGGQAHRRPDRAPTLGHASVLTRAKGVFYLLDLFKRLLVDLPEARLIIAGPTSDPQLLEAIEAAVARNPASIDYRGMVTGAAKEMFYRDIDLFVLPTTLIDEAEPLVMLEAYASGVDVVATDTGCIADRIIARDRLLTMDLDTDSALILRRLTAMSTDWEHARAAHLAHLEGINTEAQKEAKSFTTLLLDPARDVTTT